ncbi:MAG TPA: hypothetical protein DD618_01850 [Acholeplasmatales bacterium]|nr:hypothetical protein [Acholeplasmatales bacterium]
MKILANHATGKVLKSDAFQISTEAKNAKKLDPAVLDCTLGTFHYEDHQFRTFQTVKDFLFSLPDDQVFAYATSDGGPDFENAVLNWVFEAERGFIEEQMFLKAIPTPGGTGALSSIIFNSLDAGEILLFPNLAWGPYSGIAANRNLNVSKYRFLNGDHFDFESFVLKADQIIAKQNKLVTIINDPCNNPTGYSLSPLELEKIIEYLNRQKCPSVLIYDAAYLDFAYEGRNASRAKFRLFAKANENVLINVAFSASKTFAVYGQRLGSQIIVGKDREAVRDFYNAANFTARNNWSNCNKGLISILIGFDKNPTIKQTFLKELDDVVATIKRRSDLFLKEAQAVGLKTYPYHSGFFVTIPVKDKDQALMALKETAKLYLLPFDDSVRVALCGITLSEVTGLAARIKNALAGLE